MLEKGENCVKEKGILTFDGGKFIMEVFSNKG